MGGCTLHTEVTHGFLPGLLELCNKDTLDASCSRVNGGRQAAAERSPCPKSKGGYSLLEVIAYT